MPYYNDPSGLGSWWVNDNETPDQARKRHEAAQGAPLMVLPEGDFASPGRLGGVVPTNDPLHIARRQALLTGGLATPPPTSSAVSLIPDGKPSPPLHTQRTVVTTPFKPMASGTAPTVSGTMQLGAANPTGGGLADTLSPVNTGTSTNDLLNQILQQSLNLRNVEGRGFSPEALAMMRTQAIEDVPARFDRAAADLMTSLRRRGGGLPAGGDTLRETGQFLADREATRAGLLQDVILANEAERVRSREADRAFGLQTVGLAGDLAQSRGQLELGQGELDLQRQLGLGDLDLRRELGLGDLGLRQQELGQRMDLAQLDVASRERLAQLGIDSNERLAQVDANLRRELNQSGIDANLLMNRLDNETRLKMAEIQMKGDSALTRVLGSVGSSILNNPRVQGAVSDGIGWVMDRITGKASPTQVASTAGGTAAASAIGAKTGFGSKLAAFATNPWTIGIAGAAAGAFILYKKFGTDHLRADELVQKFQNPFSDTFIVPMHQEFFKAAEAGQLSGEQASAARAEFVSGWEEYVEQIRTWAGDNGSKIDVMNQSINTLWPLIQRIVGDMDNVIARGGHDYGMRAA